MFELFVKCFFVYLLSAKEALMDFGASLALLWSVFRRLRISSTDGGFIMKRKISFFVVFCMLISVLAFTVSAESDGIRTPTDVPKVIITSTKNVWTDYVDCSVEIIDEEGGSFETIFDDASKVKVRGNSTSSGEKKPFNIKFSSKTDVLGMGKNKKWCLLANCYERTLIRNQTVFDFADGIGLAYTPSYRVVDVYLNERFLGSYLY